MGCATSQPDVDVTASPHSNLPQSQQQADTWASLPERLTLGLTIEAMDELIKALPEDAIEQCNAANRDRGYLENTELNGYVNQFCIARASQADGLSTCERLQKQGHPGVGKATIFVSWHLDTSLATLLDAMSQYLAQHPELPRDTKWWVCDFVIRQGAAAEADVALLGECVCAVAYTVLLMEPSRDPMPLQRAYCIKEMYYTQKSGARFEVAMSSAQHAAFETALMDDFDSIKGRLSRVDVRTAECRECEETRAILDELEREAGLVECNRVVRDLLNGTLVAQGKAALERLPTAHERRPLLLANLASLLFAAGDLDGAEPFLRGALQGKREAVGDRHPDTLACLNNLGMLHKARGDFDSAAALYTEALQVKRETLGDRHANTLVSVNNLGMLLKEKGDLDGAALLLREAMQARRETLGVRNNQTLMSIWNLALLLQQQGQEGEAKELCQEAMTASKEVLGVDHPTTQAIMSNSWGIC